MIRREHPNFLWLAFGVLALMNIIDVWYTSMLVKSPTDEANPIMAYVMVQSGLNGVIAVKLIGLALVSPFVRELRKMKVAENFFYAAVAGYTVLTFYHLWGYLIVNTPMFV